MAIARCEECGKPTKRVTLPGYSEIPYLPMGHPNSGIICGTHACENQGIIWLKLDEEQEYQRKQRIFKFSSNTAKVKVQ